MADPLSIAAGVMAVVTAAATSAQFIQNFVDGIKTVPKDLAETMADLAALERILFSIAQQVEKQRTGSRNRFDTRMEDLKHVGEDCQSTLDEFRRFLEQKQKDSLLNRMAIHLKRGEINRHHNRIRRYKETLTLALMQMTSQETALSAELSAQHSRDLHRLEEVAERTLNKITGQLQGLELAVSEISAGQDTAVLAVLKKEEERMVRCSAFCLPVLQSAALATGNNIKYMEAFDEASQFFGNVGEVKGIAPAINVDQMVGRDKSRQVVGNIDSTAFEALFSRR